MPQLDRRQLLKLFGAAAAAGATGAVSGCGSTEPPGMQMERPSGRTISIGLVSPALGVYSRLGADMTRGFMLYLDDHDGLLGRHQVDLRRVEEGATAKTATAAVKGLLTKDGGVLAIAGVANPSALAAVAGMMQDAKVPLLSSGAAPAGLTSALFVWRVGQVDGEAGRSLASYAYGEGRNAYIIWEESASALEECVEFKAAYQDLGGHVIAESHGKLPFIDRLTDAVAQGADVIFGAYTGPDALDLLEAYRASGLTVKLLGPGALTETVDLTKLGTLPSRVYTSMFYAPDLNNEANRRFVANYHKANGVAPSAYAMAAYDAASVLDKALHLVDGEPTPAALNHALSLLGQIDSPRGTWSFNIRRAPQQRWYLRRLRVDGQVPANLLDADLMVLS